MQTSRIILIAAWNCILTVNAFGQGSLTPPGAPAPTMKRLDQIEARTPISTLPYPISASGSYYLTANLNVTSGTAITVAADNVTLDLNGFTLSSTEAAPAGTGILLSGTRAHIHIVNGHIRGYVTGSLVSYTGAGFLNGVSYSGTARNVRVSGVSVSGCMNYGIYLPFSAGATPGFISASTLIESCTADTVGGRGLVAASVSNSAAYNCGSDAIAATSALNCYGHCSGLSGAGVRATSATNCIGHAIQTGVSAGNANNCSGYSSSAIGLSASTASNCYGWSRDLGMSATIASNCYAEGFGSIGLYSTIAINCYATTDNYFGISSVQAIGCYGYSGGWVGLNASQSAFGCYGESRNRTGLSARIANNCVGVNNSSFASFDPGLSAQVAIGCYGQCATGTGLSAVIGNSCIGSGTPAVSVTYKYNMP